VPLDFSVLYVRELERLRRVFTLAPPDVLRRDTVEAAKITWITACSLAAGFVR
jgi:hypothetical protein